MTRTIAKRPVILALQLVALAALVVGCSDQERRLIIAYSNDMVGEIRSCGCVSNDYGGLGRRATYLTNLRKMADDFLLFEGGDFFGLDVNYGKEKADLTLQAMTYMEYNGMVLGEKDFAHGLEYIVEKVDKLKLPVVMANLVDTQTNELVFPASRTFRLPGGLRVGVVGVIGTGLEFPEQVPPGRLHVASPTAAVEREVTALRNDVDLVVVLAHMPGARARRLAQTARGVDIVVNGHDARPMRKTRKSGGAYVVATSDRGRFMGVAWGTLDAHNELIEFDAAVEPLSTDYSDHEAIVKLFQSYDMEIARKEKARVSTGVPQGELAKSPLVGAETCKECHPDIHEQWSGTAHAHAFEILERENRQFDRDCTPCHTTGFYELGGFLSLVDTPHLTDIQCEACHGNGATHSRNPDISTTGRARSVCTRCHTEEQTPGFSFDERWPLIAH